MGKQAAFRVFDMILCEKIVCNICIQDISKDFMVFFVFFINM